MHELLSIAIFGSRVRRFANNWHEWRSPEWTLLQIAWRIYFFYFSHAMLCAWNNYWSPISPLSPRTVFSDLVLNKMFLLFSCDVTTVDLSRHANVGFWHCDVIFVDRSCARKLVQRRSSLVNSTANMDLSPPDIQGLVTKCSSVSCISKWDKQKFPHTSPTV